MKCVGSRAIATLLSAVLAVSTLPATAIAEAPELEMGEEPVASAVAGAQKSSDDVMLDDASPSASEDGLQNEALSVADDAAQQGDAELSAQSVVASGTLKNGSCTWSLDSAGVLRINAVAGKSGSMGDDPIGTYWDYRSSVRSVVVGEGVTCTSLAFSGMPNLTSVTLPKSMKSFGGKFAADNEECGGGFLIEGSAVTSITIPADLQEVWGGYYYDGEMNPIGFPFSGAGALRRVTFTDGMKKIPSSICRGDIYDMNGNESLSEFVGRYSNNDFVRYKDWQAHPLSLEEVTIPASVTSIGEYAFHECGHIKKINYGGSPSEWKKVSIADGNEGLTGATIQYGRQDPKPFPDVPSGAWYAGVVGRATAMGLMSGYANGNFGPDDKISRGQVAVILWNMAKRPAAGRGAKTFPDVRSDQYYYAAVRWASSVGVVNGYANGNFGPDDDVTREQLAVMLASYRKNVAGKQVSGSAADYSEMTDHDKVSSWAAPAVGWCFKNKIMSGSKGKVLPQGNATRAETAKMVVALHDLPL